MMFVRRYFSCPDHGEIPDDQAEVFNRRDGSDAAWRHVNCGQVLSSHNVWADPTAEAAAGEVPQ